MLARTWELSWPTLSKAMGRDSFSMACCWLPLPPLEPMSPPLDPVMDMEPWWWACGAVLGALVGCGCCCCCCGACGCWWWCCGWWWPTELPLKAVAAWVVADMAVAVEARAGLLPLLAFPLLLLVAVATALVALLLPPADGDNCCMAWSTACGWRLRLVGLLGSGDACDCAGGCGLGVVAPGPEGGAETITGTRAADWFRSTSCLSLSGGTPPGGSMTAVPAKVAAVLLPSLARRPFPRRRPPPPPPPLGPYWFAENSLVWVVYIRVALFGSMLSFTNSINISSIHDH